MRKSNRHVRNEGFSLVEIVLALMVVAIGLLSVFGLMGDSLSANTKTRDDTVAATFAESVFSSVFAADWDDDEYNILMDEESFWDENSGKIRLDKQKGQIDVNKYLYKEIGYYTLKYDLWVDKRKDASGNNAGSNADAVWRALRLRVWIGEFADTSQKNEDVYEFYTEQYRFIDPKEEYESDGSN